MDSATKRRPWFKMRPQAWQSDNGLQSCGYAARGLWAECMMIMHQSEEYGFLLHRGEPMSAEKLARLTRGSVSEVESLLSELEAEGVFSRREEDGAIYSRRMVADFAAGELGRESIVRRWGGDDSQNEKPKWEPYRDPNSPPNRSPNSPPNRSPNSPPNRSPNRNPNTKNPESRIQNPEYRAANRDAISDPHADGFSDQPEGVEVETQDFEPTPPSKPTRRGGRALLPDDWNPRQKERELAAELNFTESEFADGVERFRDWASRRGTKSAAKAPNWDATFRNDLRKYAREIGAIYRKAAPPGTVRPSEPAPSSEASGAIHTTARGSALYEQMRAIAGDGVCRSFLLNCVPGPGGENFRMSLTPPSDYVFGALNDGHLARERIGSKGPAIFTALAAAGVRVLPPKKSIERGSVL